MATLTRRESQLQDFLDAAHAVLALAATRHPGAVRVAAERLFARLAIPAPASQVADTPRPPAHRMLAPALDLARRASPDLAGLADRLARIEPRLGWKRSARAGMPVGALDDGYCGAIVVGADGLERRDDLRIGISLMAPGVTYPDHSHPPEEIYIVMSGGEWRQDAQPWHAPGRGGLVHSPPGITHAMRATHEPLLAIWFLLVDDAIQPGGGTA